MENRRKAILAVCGLFVAALLLALATHSTGVIANDPERRIWVPEQLTIPLQVQAAYNDRQVFFRYRWPAPEPHVYTHMLRFTGGEWQREDFTPVGPHPAGLYEDRLAMMLDDGSVPEFQRYGGYITVGANMHDFSSDDPQAQANDAHRRKYLPATRLDPDDWYSIVDEETLAAQREAGYFLDLWHWRAHLSNPLGHADDQHVAWYRLYDSGRTLFTRNWDAASGQPLWMFDPERAGRRALRWEAVTETRSIPAERYYLAEDEAVPYDPGHAWQEGDVLPGRLVREPAGSRASIRVVGQGRWADGAWDVTLARDLDTGFPLEDKILREQGVYDVAMSVHRDGRASRWHYISMPLQVGLGRPAEYEARRFSGERPDWDSVPVREVTLFYPGQVSWPRLTSRVHAGSTYIAKGVPVKFRHKESQLAQYGLEIEFEREIMRQWWLTMIAGALLIVSFVFSVTLLLRRKED